jgi:hypothetical protein
MTHALKLGWYWWRSLEYLSPLIFLFHSSMPGGTVAYKKLSSVTIALNLYLPRQNKATFVLDQSLSGTSSRRVTYQICLSIFQSTDLCMHFVRGLEFKTTTRQYKCSMNKGSFVLTKCRNLHKRRVISNEHTRQLNLRCYY